MYLPDPSHLPSNRQEGEGLNKSANFQKGRYEIQNPYLHRPVNKIVIYIITKTKIMSSIIFN